MNRIIFVALAAACITFSGCGRHEPVAASVFPTAEIAKASAEIERSPDLALGHTNLAMLYMKEARKTGDFALNEKAAAAIADALAIEPNNIPARKLEASLHLAHHRFAEAAEAAGKLIRELPSDSFAYGVLADAYMETGDYEKAVAAAQQMVDLKPGTASYSRVAQLRALHGDHKGAIDMYTQAARAADPADNETRGWCLVQLGDEFWKNGKYAEAEKAYDEALQVYPDYFLALVSKGRVRAALGDYTAAEKFLMDAQARTVNANAMVLLAEIHSIRGNAAESNRLYDEFEAMQDKLGTAADHRKLGLTWADRGKLAKALELAESEYAAEKSLYSADLLAWALYRSGNASRAQGYIREAMRLKTNDATLLFHAGMIAKANGDRKEGARLLRSALSLNPGFSLVRAEEARAALAEVK